MRALIPGLLALFLLLAGPAAHAAEAEAKDVARNANCAPGKVEVLRRVQGANGETVYRIACTGQKDVSVTVRCIGRLCILLR